MFASATRRLALLWAIASTGVAGVAFGGLNYATGSMKVPLSNSDGMAVVNSWGVNRIKLFYRSTAQMSVINKTIANAEVVLGFTNTELTKLASNYTYVYSSLSPYKAYNSIIKFVAVGNEVDTSALFNSSTLPTILLNASSNMNTALTALGMGAKVVSPLTLGVLGWDVTPPSSARFSTKWQPTVLPFLSFLNRTGSVFMVNMYPFLSWVTHPSDYTLAYALADPSSSYTDGTKKYTSLLDQQYDAVYYALKAAGYGQLPIVIGETGWPTSGADGATVQNACTYNNRIISQLTNSNRGTPAQPGRRLPFYLFEAFDELAKGASSTEPYWGMAYENGTSKYNIDWTNGAAACSSARKRRQARSKKFVPRARKFLSVNRADVREVSETDMAV